MIKFLLKQTKAQIPSIALSRSFSSSGNFQWHSAIDTLPYKFKNMSTLIKTRDTTPDADLSKMKLLVLHDRKYNFVEGIKIAYQAFLQGMADGDTQFLREIAENNLADNTVEGLIALEKAGYKMEILNENQPDIKVDLVDFDIVCGAEIDRRENKKNKLTKLPFSPTPFTHMYMAGGFGFSMKKTIKIMGVFKLKVSTPTKLNIVDPHGVRLVNEGFLDIPEIHFPQFESIAKEVELDIKKLSALIKEGMNSSLEFKDWTLTDFDSYLNGNPHA